MKLFSLRMLSMAALLSSALVISAPTAQALLIDSFDQDQAEVIDAIGGGGTTGTNDTVLIGTELNAPERQIFSEVTTHNNNPNGHLTGEVTGGQYIHSQDTGIFGYSRLTYTGFGNADFTTGGTFGLSLQIVESDLGAQAILSLTDGSNVTGSKTLAIPQVSFGSPQNLLFLFTDLVPGINPANITKLVLEIDGRRTSSLDVAVDFVATATPEPTSLLLIGSGLLGLGWLRRKQKNS